MKQNSRVAIDFDGVVANTTVGKRAWILDNLGLRYSERACSRSDLVPVIGDAQYSLMQANVGFADTLAAFPMSGCVYWLRRLSSCGRVFIVSARPKEKIVWVGRWLDAWGLTDAVSDVISSHGLSKMQVVRHIGAQCLVDDDIRHLRDDRSARRILFGSAGIAVDDGLEYAPRWNDVFRLSKLD